MLAISVEGSQSADGCITCCCETVALKPGTVEPLRMNYAPWAVPIAPRGLHCVPTIDVEEKVTCPTPAAGAPIPADPVRYAVAFNTQFVGDLNDQVTDPDDDPLTYKALPLYGPKLGVLDLEPDGTFVYTPNSGAKGADRFFAQVTDGNTAPVVFEVLLGVGVDETTVKGTWDLTVGKPQVDNRLYTVIIPLQASPAAKPCQVFRVTIRQGALDCDCECYWRIDCVDVRIAQC